MRQRRFRPQLLLPPIILLAPLLACGGFQVRVTPSPVPTAETLTAAPTEAPIAPTARPPTATLAPSATSAPTPTSTVPAGLAPSAKARVSAAGGLNVREKASAKSKLVGKLNANASVSLLEGPVEAENFSWWRVDNGSGVVGWVAAGPKNDPWLVPGAAASATNATPEPTAGPKVLDRPVKLGDTVQVTTSPALLLTVRASAGTNATAVARVRGGTLFKVRGGPVKENGLTWWELEGEVVKGWAAEGQGQERWLAPVEQ